VKFVPYTVTRWGFYGAAATASLSVWLGHNAGASLDFLMLRAVFVFVIVAVLGLGADAVLSMSIPTPPADSRPARAPETSDGGDLE
jgi:hypothetical protein